MGNPRKMPDRIWVTNETGSGDDYRGHYGYWVDPDTKGRNDTEYVRADLVKELEEEVLEQARLLGMGGERELRLMARVEELEREVERLRAADATSAGPSPIWIAARREALEEAARVCDDLATGSFGDKSASADYLAVAIRALMEKKNES
jgi:hypothetical protein